MHNSIDRRPRPGAERTIVPLTAPQTSTGSSRSRRARVGGWPLLAFLIAVITSQPAIGQIFRLDPDLPRSVTLSPTQADQLDEFIALHADNAFGDDRAMAARSLDELIEPLVGEGVSVAFRQAMADRLMDRISAALTDQPVMLADEAGNESINHKPYHAMRLAGEIATNTTLQRVIEELDSDDQGRAYFAVHSIETVFYRMRTNAPAVSSSLILSIRQGAKPTGLVPDLGELMVRAKSGRRAAAVARALAEAAELPDDDVPNAADEALRLIADGAAARIRASADTVTTFDDTLCWLTSGQRLVRVIAQPGSANEATSLAAIRLGGQLIAAVYRDLDSGRDPGRVDVPGAKVHNQMLGLAENLLLFGEQNAAAASNRRVNSEMNAAADQIQELLADGNENDFRRAALALISTNGILTDEPYRFSDDEFIVE